MKLRPLNDRILVERVKEEEKTKGEQDREDPDSFQVQEQQGK